VSGGGFPRFLNRSQKRCRSVWERKKDNRYSFDVPRPYVNLKCDKSEGCIRFMNLQPNYKILSRPILSSELDIQVSRVIKLAESQSSKPPSQPEVWEESSGCVTKCRLPLPRAKLEATDQFQTPP
jgi:hypothetical protein